MNFFDVVISEEAKNNVLDCLSSGYISEGELVRKFEIALSEMGLENPVAVNSGTAALHIALETGGVQCADEVIIPAQTFVATGLAVMMTGAKPVFADIDLKTGNLCPGSVKRMISDRTKAIIPVHWAGYPCEMDELSRIAEEHDLFLLEDAAHALGALYKGKPVGSLSRFAAFSFQAIKHCTTGDGGAVSCVDPEDSESVRTLRWFGIDRRKTIPSVLGEREFDIARVGYKYHMNDIAAAIGIGNLKQFHSALRRRREIGKRYRNELMSRSGVTLLECRNPEEHAFWLFSMLVENRTGFISMMTGAGIPVSVVHQGIDKYSVFMGCRRDSMTAQREFDERHIAIPLHSSLGDEEVSSVIEHIRNGW